MAADSLPRRLAKHALAPYLNERFYGTIHALSMARDIRFGIWKEPELDLIAYAVRAGETALDIGANYGLYSYYLSRALGHNGRVYAFEPIPYTVNVFKTV